MEGEPEQRVEPVQDLERGDDPLEGEIASADVGEFVEENVAQFVAAEFVDEAERQEEPGADKAVKSGAAHSVGFQEADGGPDAHGGLAQGEKFQRGGILDGVADTEATGEENVLGE